MNQRFTKFMCSALCATVFTFVGCNNGEEPTPADSEKKLDHLIFEEICYTGTWKIWEGAGKLGEQPYKEDQYLKITNPTEQTLFLDGLGLLNTYFVTDQLHELANGTDFRDTHIGTETLLRFPGNVGENRLPIAPGQSVYIARVAFNHTVDPTPSSGDGEDDNDEGFFMWNKNSYNLSDVDFEWGTKEQIENDGMFPENPDVPNMVSVYPPNSEELPYLIPKYGAVALIKIPAEVTNEQLLNDPQYKWDTTWIDSEKIGRSIPGTRQDPEHEHNSGTIQILKIPNEWVIDAVQISSQAEYAWNVVSEKLDKGFTGVYISEADLKSRPKDYAEKALFRKHDGKKFVDNNNSSEDFEVRTASKAEK
ncbi:DUF4876 domain-containing protein [Bacteroides sp. AN502(2024)]|uniref:DUF4876 domain-containing protein n=1 Tax=Bacteroides sp. AN502(2024) TaxID=3160599 RepID=UPI0035197C31